MSSKTGDQWWDTMFEEDDDGNGGTESGTEGKPTPAADPARVAQPAADPAPGSPASGNPAPGPGSDGGPAPA